MKDLDGSTVNGRKDSEMKLIIAFIKPFKLEEVRDSLKAVGVTGMSVSDVSGFGRQRGQTEVYRGAEYEVEFVPKVRLEVIVTDELAGPAVAAIESAAHTGEIGDGKIVVVAVEDVVRIRTSERGADAI
jgi:nitrogen regulatory protein PII